MVAAMEESYAKGEIKDPSAINALKGSLIGPLAGIGDSFFLIVLASLLGVTVDLSMQGNPLGVIILTVVISVVWYLGLYYGLTQGYYKGEALLERLTGEESSTFMRGINMVGAMVIGGLVGAWIKVSTPIADGLLQSQLDGLLPMLIPLGFTILSFNLLKKGWSAVRLMILLLGIGVICGHFGILATP